MTLSKRWLFCFSQTLTRSRSGPCIRPSFAFVTAYIFGREYKEGTERTLLTTPLRREYIVAAKMVVVAVWVFGLMVFSLALQSAGAAVFGVGGFAWKHLWAAFGDAFVVTLLLYLTLPLVAWIAMAGRGYLRAMLFAFAMMAVGNGLAVTDISPYYPWNMPIHVVGASWMPIPPSELNAGSWIVALAVFAVGMALAIRQIDVADAAA